jgi:hypothetical protein
MSRESDLRPFSFEDLPYRDGKRVEPASWGPIYTKPAKPGRKIAVDTWPTNAPSGQKTAHVDDAKHRAKIRAEFQAAANRDRVAWATGKGIVEAYKQAMREKRAREAAMLDEAARAALPRRFPLAA